MTLSRRLSAAAAVAAAVFAPARLAGQEAPVDLEVVVTASRIEEPAERAAASVTVITAGELEASGQVTLVDALERVAGVSFRSTTGSPSKAEVSMGGFGENSHGRVLVLVDGRRANRPDMAGPNWLQVPVENVERVEVLRGPATALYGDHAVGGVINIITKKPADRFTVTASGMGGSFGLNQERLGVSGPAGPVRFALSGERTACDGHRDRSAWSSLGGSVGLEARLFGDVEASLRLGYNRTDTELPGALSKAQWKADPTQAVNRADEAADRTLDADLGLKALAGEAAEMRLNAFYVWKAVANDIASWGTYTDVVIQTVGATPRASFSADLPVGALEASGGVDLYWDRLALARFADAGRSTQTADVEVSKLSAGAYASAALAFAERFAVAVAGRYELTRIAAEASLGSTLDDSKIHHGIAGSLSASWRPAKSAKIYAKADRVYRYPFVDEQVGYSGYSPDAFYGDLDPETGYGAEIGLDVALREQLRLAARGCWLEMKDEIAFFDPDGWGGVPGWNVNQDATRRLGATVEASWKPGSLALSASYTAQLATFRVGANKGNEVPLVPNHEIAGEARLRLPAGFEVSANTRYVGASYQGGDNANTQDTVPPYFLLGAAITWRPEFVPGRLELFAGVENLLDAQYVSYVYWDGYYPAPGRNWRVGGFWRY